MKKAIKSKLSPLKRPRQGRDILRSARDEDLNDAAPDAGETEGAPRQAPMSQKKLRNQPAQIVKRKANSGPAIDSDDEDPDSRANRSRGAEAEEVNPTPDVSAMLDNDVDESDDDDAYEANSDAGNDDQQYSPQQNSEFDFTAALPTPQCDVTDHIIEMTEQRLKDGRAAQALHRQRILLEIQQAQASVDETLKREWEETAVSMDSSARAVAVGSPGPSMNARMVVVSTARDFSQLTTADHSSMTILKSRRDNMRGLNQPFSFKSSCSKEMLSELRIPMAAALDEASQLLVSQGERRRAELDDLDSEAIFTAVHRLLQSGKTSGKQRQASNQLDLVSMKYLAAQQLISCTRAQPIMDALKSFNGRLRDYGADNETFYVGMPPGEVTKCNRQLLKMTLSPQWGANVTVTNDFKMATTPGDPTYHEFKTPGDVFDWLATKLAKVEQVRERIDMYSQSNTSQDQQMVRDQPYSGGRERGDSCGRGRGDYSGRG